MKKLTIVVILGLVLVSNAAFASPWTLAEKKMSLTLSYDYQQASDEFLDNGDLQKFPLSGEFSSNSLRFDIRYGLTDSFELALGLGFKDNRYSADPAIIEFTEGATMASLPDARGQILNFNRSVTGLSDIYPAIRYNLSPGIIRVTSQTRVKLPSGYDPPSSTLNDTGAVVDDVSLGDGQIDIEQAFLFGSFIDATNTFFRVDMGGRLRLGEPGHQFFGSFKIGQFIGPKIAITASIDGQITPIKGEPVGTTFVANSGDLTAQNITTDQIIAKDLFLDKDLVSVGFGALFIVKPGVELQLSGNQFIGGKNLPSITTFTFASSFSFDI